MLEQLDRRYDLRMHLYTDASVDKANGAAYVIPALKVLVPDRVVPSR